MKKFEIGMIKSYTDIFGGEQVLIQIEKIENNMIYYREYIPISVDSEKSIERELTSKKIEINNDSECFKVWTYHEYNGYIYANED